MRRLLSPHKWRQVHCEATASAPLIVNIFTFKSILLQHQFLASVTAIVAQEQELAEISGQLPTKPPWLWQPQVFHLVILFPHPLSTTYHLLLLNLGGAKSQLWRGWMCRPSPPSMWTALHHLPHHDHHHQDSPLWVCGFPYATPTATPHHCLDYGLCY